VAAEKTVEKAEVQKKKESKPRKKSWASGIEQVKLGLMTMDQLNKGVEMGVYSPNPAERDYGVDTPVYNALRKQLEAANEAAKVTVFRIVGSSKE